MVDIKPEFMVFLAVSIAWIVYTIFYNSQIVALILSAFIRRFFVPKHDYFRLDSVTINLLGGKIQFRGLHYANRDMYFRGATGYLLIRYWAGRWNEDGHVKPYDDDCRVSVRVDGAAIHMYNNGAKYDELKNLLIRREQSAGHYDNDVDDDDDDGVTARVPIGSARAGAAGVVEKPTRSWFFDHFPTFFVNIYRLTLVVGNPFMNSVLQCESRYVKGTLSTTGTCRSLRDVYRQEALLQMVKPKLSLEPNNHQWHALLRDNNGNPVLRSGYVFAGVLVEDSRRSTAASATAAAAANSNNNSSVNASSTAYEPGQLLLTQRIDLHYINDVPGPVTAGSLACLDKDDKGPQFSIEITLPESAKICYGPHENRLRALLQSFLVPWDFKDHKPARAPCLGDTRTPSSFDLTVTFAAEATLAVGFVKREQLLCDQVKQHAQAIRMRNAQQRRGRRKRSPDDPRRQHLRRRNPLDDAGSAGEFRRVDAGAGVGLFASFEESNDLDELSATYGSVHYDDVDIDEPIFGDDRDDDDNNDDMDFDSDLDESNDNGLVVDRGALDERDKRRRRFRAARRAMARGKPLGADEPASSVADAASSRSQSNLQQPDSESDHVADDNRYDDDEDGDEDDEDDESADDVFGLLAPNDGAYQTLRCTLGAGSRIDYSLPLVVGADGYTPTVVMVAQPFTVVTDLAYPHLIQCRSFEVAAYLSTPLQWNGSRVWVFDFTMLHPDIHYLKCQVEFLQTLMRDWTIGPATPIDRFVPIRYEMRIKFADYRVLFCTNEGNIVESTLFADNSYVAVSGRILELAIVLDFTMFNQSFSDTSVLVTAADLRMGLQLAASSTIRRHLDDLNRPYITVGVFEAIIEYHANTTVADGNLDTLSVSLHLSRTHWRFFGHFLRHLLLLRDNYFGDHQMIKSKRAFEASRRDRMVPRTRTNAFELTVVAQVDHILLTLPHHLYQLDDDCPIVTCPELVVDIRSLPAYMDIQLNTAPITAVVPVVGTVFPSHPTAIPAASPVTTPISTPTLSRAPPSSPVMDARFEPSRSRVAAAGGVSNAPPSSPLTPDDHHVSQQIPVPPPPRLDSPVDLFYARARQLRSKAGSGHLVLDAGCFRVRKYYGPWSPIASGPYSNDYTLALGALFGEVSPTHLRVILDHVVNFDYSLDAKNDRVFIGSLARIPSDEFVRTAVHVDVPLIELAVVDKSTAILAQLPDGLHFHYDGVFRAGRIARKQLRIPSVVVHHLIDHEKTATAILKRARGRVQGEKLPRVSSSSSEPSTLNNAKCTWVEVGALSLDVLLTSDVRVDDWRDRKIKQRQFLRENDAELRQLQFLWVHKEPTNRRVGASVSAAFMPRVSSTRPGAHPSQSQPRINPAVANARKGYSVNSFLMPHLPEDATDTTDSGTVEHQQRQQEQQYSQQTLRSHQQYTTDALSSEGGGSANSPTMTRRTPRLPSEPHSAFAHTGTLRAPLSRSRRTRATNPQSRASVILLPDQADYGLSSLGGSGDGDDGSATVTTARDSMSVASPITDRATSRFLHDDEPDDARETAPTLPVALERVPRPRLKTLSTADSRGGAHDSLILPEPDLIRFMIQQHADAAKASGTSSASPPATRSIHRMANAPPRPGILPQTVERQTERARDHGEMESAHSESRGDDARRTPSYHSPSTSSKVSSASTPPPSHLTRQESTYVDAVDDTLVEYDDDFDDVPDEDDDEADTASFYSARSSLPSVGSSSHSRASLRARRTIQDHFEVGLSQVRRATSIAGSQSISLSSVSISSSDGPGHSGDDDLSSGLSSSFDDDDDDDELEDEEEDEDEEEEEDDDEDDNDDDATGVDGRRHRRRRPHRQLGEDLKTIHLSSDLFFEDNLSVSISSDSSDNEYDFDDDFDDDDDDDDEDDDDHFDDGAHGHGQTLPTSSSMTSATSRPQSTSDTTTTVVATTAVGATPLTTLAPSSLAPSGTSGSVIVPDPVADSAIPGNLASSATSAVVTSDPIANGAHHQVDEKHPRRHKKMKKTKRPHARMFHDRDLLVSGVFGASDSNKEALTTDAGPDFSDGAAYLTDSRQVTASSAAQSDVLNGTNGKAARDERKRKKKRRKQQKKLRETRKTSQDDGLGDIKSRSKRRHKHHHKRRQSPAPATLPGSSNAGFTSINGNAPLDYSMSPLTVASGAAPSSQDVASPLYAGAAAGATGTGSPLTTSGGAGGGTAIGGGAMGAGGSQSAAAAAATAAASAYMANMVGSSLGGEWQPHANKRVNSVSELYHSVLSAYRLPLWTPTNEYGGLNSARGECVVEGVRPCVNVHAGPVYEMRSLSATYEKRNQDKEHASAATATSSTAPKSSAPGASSSGGGSRNTGKGTARPGVSTSAGGKLHASGKNDMRSGLSAFAKHRMGVDGVGLSSDEKPLNRDPYTFTDVRTKSYVDVFLTPMSVEALSILVESLEEQMIFTSASLLDDMERAYDKTIREPGAMPLKRKRYGMSLPGVQLMLLAHGGAPKNPSTTAKSAARLSARRSGASALQREGLYVVSVFLGDTGLGAERVTSMPAPSADELPFRALERGVEGSGFLSVDRLLTRLMWLGDTRRTSTVASDKSTSATGGGGGSVGNSNHEPAFNAHRDGGINSARLWTRGFDTGAHAAVLADMGVCAMRGTVQQTAVSADSAAAYAGVSESEATSGGDVDMVVGDARVYDMWLVCSHASVSGIESFIGTWYSHVHRLSSAAATLQGRVGLERRKNMSSLARTSQVLPRRQAEKMSANESLLNGRPRFRVASDVSWRLLQHLRDCLGEMSHQRRLAGHSVHKEALRRLLTSASSRKAEEAQQFGAVALLLKPWCQRNKDSLGMHARSLILPEFGVARDLVFLSGATPFNTSEAHVQGRTQTKSGSVSLGRFRLRLYEWSDCALPAALATAPRNELIFGNVLAEARVQRSGERRTDEGRGHGVVFVSKQRLTTVVRVTECRVSLSPGILQFADKIQTL